MTALLSQLFRYSHRYQPLHMPPVVLLQSDTLLWIRGLMWVVYLQILLILLLALALNQRVQLLAFTNIAIPACCAVDEARRRSAASANLPMTRALQMGQKADISLFGSVKPASTRSVSLSNKTTPVSTERPQLPPWQLSLQRPGVAAETQQAWLQAASTYQQAGQADLAILYLQDVLRADPAQPQALKALHALWQQTSQVQAAEEVQQQRCYFYPEDDTNICEQTWTPNP